MSEQNLCIYIYCIKKFKFLKCKIMECYIYFFYAIYNVTTALHTDINKYQKGHQIYIHRLMYIFWIKHSL